MDIKGKINDIVDRVKSDKDFSAKFQNEPIKAVESVLGVGLPDDQLKALVEGVKAKLAAGQAGDALGSLKKLF